MSILIGDELVRSFREMYMVPLSLGRFHSHIRYSQTMIPMTWPLITSSLTQNSFQTNTDPATGQIIDPDAPQ